jgi:hypothetical protein
VLRKLCFVKNHLFPGKFFTEHTQGLRTNLTSSRLDVWRFTSWPAVLGAEGLSHCPLLNISHYFFFQLSLQGIPEQWNWTCQPNFQVADAPGQAKGEGFASLNLTTLPLFLMILLGFPQSLYGPMWDW